MSASGNLFAPMSVWAVVSALATDELSGGVGAALAGALRSMRLPSELEVLRSSWAWAAVKAKAVPVSRKAASAARVLVTVIGGTSLESGLAVTAIRLI